MIKIGLTGWGDHDSLYEGITKSSEKLSVYAGHFPTVEIDSTFYAVQPLRNMEKWAYDTPDSFSFVVKAYQGLTGHQRGDGNPFSTREEMFDAFLTSLDPLQKSGKLAMVLCQFPPWFECKKENVQYLRYCKEYLNDVPCALEFRHQSWFAPEFKEQTLSFMEKEKWIHSICDEPQAGARSIPFVLDTAGNDDVLFRFHGRNVAGWNKPANGQEWRDVRYLYEYNQQELEDLAGKVKKAYQSAKNVYVLFNNNSGGHAAGNAKTMIDILGLDYKGLAPRQLDLFD
ncbi:DUF72 domain-containing protein [Bacillus sp. H-16]|uniref:DUF72 domain-containing protein n=1 Tax=Alteribacter salitolerans TaxID=2912333 RepID=UPI001963E4B9|nr:DUF72 domain-containing protein [Alteribacter salitolerans]MBM7096991.1 DUF72 domain-containing protein [Alteribacter salitolerans]